MNLREFNRIVEMTLLLPLVLLLSLAVLLAWQFNRTWNQQQDVDHSDLVTAQLNEIERLVVDEETGLRGYQLMHDKTMLEPLYQAREPLNSGFAALRTLVRNDPEQLQRLSRIEESQQVWFQFAGEALAAANTAAPPAGAAMNLHGKQLMDNLRSTVREMRVAEESHRNSEVRAAASQMHRLLLLLILCSAAIGAFLGIFTWRNLRRVSRAYQGSIAEARKHAGALDESRQWLRTALESIGDALIVCDVHGSIRLMNPVAQTLTGWSFREAEGKPLEEIFHVVNAETRDPIANPLERVRREKAVVGLAHPAVLLARDGAEYVIDDSAAPIRTREGELSGVVLVFRDVTAARKTQAALLANEKLAVAGRLAASLAHEIHNPLDSVANLHYLIEHEDDSAKKKHYLTVAQQELSRTLQISRAMLSLHREPKAPVEIGLTDLIESVLLLLDRRIKDQSIAVERSMQEPATITGFPGELRQVFTNLLVNAADAAGKGGRIAILVQQTRTWDGHTGVSVAVSDSGSGVAREARSHLFQPFFTTKGEMGTGLGLWVSRGIVIRHGGTLEFENYTGGSLHGATVRVFLPAHPPAHMEPRSAPFLVSNGEERDDRG